MLANVPISINGWNDKLQYMEVDAPLLDLLFYVVGGISCSYAIYGARIPFSSFAGIYLRLVGVFVYLPAYYIYRGGVLANNDASIDMFVYLILLFQILFACLVAWFVWSVKIDFKLKFAKRRGHVLVYNLILLFVITYTVAYFVHYYELIPIFKIASGDFLSVAATLRSDLTHGFEDSSIFSYYRPVTKDLLFFIVFAMIANSRTSFIAKLVLMLLLLVVLLAHLEKAYIVNILFSVVMLRVFRNNKINLTRELYIAIVLISISVFVTYLFFASSFVDAVEYIPYRLMAQIGYVPEQLQLSKPYGALLLQGVNMGGLGRLFEIKFIDISKMAFESVHPDLIMLGISGSSAGLAIADAYMIFGAMGVPLLMVIMLLHFYIDRVIRLSVLSSKVPGLSGAILVSFYIYFICFYPLFLIGSFLGIFNVPYIFQQGLILCMLSVFGLFRVTLVRCLD